MEESLDAAVAAGRPAAGAEVSDDGRNRGSRTRSARACGAAAATSSTRPAATASRAGLLPKMSDRPTLLEFFEKRFAPANHVLQSATRALKTGMPEEIILACLMHDTVHALVKVDHGWWGAQIIEPYVSEKVTFAIRHHQTLRFYPDEKFGYEYPESYLRTFGEDYKPEPYLEQNYQLVRNHKWYELPRLVTVNDLYSFDPNAKVSIEPFIDIIGRHFKQPKEGHRLRQQPDGAHVAHDHVPGSPALSSAVGHRGRSGSSMQNLASSCALALSSLAVARSRPSRQPQTYKGLELAWPA